MDVLKCPASEGRADPKLFQMLSFQAATQNSRANPRSPIPIVPSGPTPPQHNGCNPDIIRLDSAFPNLYDAHANQGELQASFISNNAVRVPGDMVRFNTQPTFPPPHFHLQMYGDGILHHQQGRPVMQLASGTHGGPTRY